MNKVQKLTAEDLYKRCDFGEFNFKSTDDLDHDNYTFLGRRGPVPRQISGYG